MVEMPQPRSLDHLLVQICRLLHSRGRKEFRALGLHRGQPPLLLGLWQQEGRTQSEIADYLHVTPATVTKMLQRMEKAGFVERRADPEDARVSRVYLTDAGHEVRSDVQRVLDTFNEETFAGFTLEEKVLLRRLLLQVRENLLQASGRGPVS
jgi:DNA-binding MarR family transcriptional regulator